MREKINELITAIKSIEGKEIEVHYCDKYTIISGYSCDLYFCLTFTIEEEIFIFKETATDNKTSLILFLDDLNINYNITL